MQNSSTDRTVLPWIDLAQNPEEFLTEFLSYFHFDAERLSTNMSSKQQKQISKHTQLRTKYLTTIKAAHNLINSPEEKSIFLARADLIDEVYKHFQREQDELINISANLEDNEDLNITNTSEECENLYYAIKAKHNELTKKSPSVPSTPPVPLCMENPKPRIPKIHIEPFDGSIEKFSSFKSLYDTMIHTSSLTNIEKFSYLISLVRGLALTIVKTIEFNDNNYQRAYDKLVLEYTNQRLVATHYLDQILSVQPSVQENPARLRYFSDHYQMLVDSIQDLNMENLADFIFLHIALKNIPLESRRLFEHELLSHDRIPTTKDLMSFIKNRLTILEISPSIDSRKPVSSDIKPTLRLSSTNTPMSAICPVCKKGHRIHQCNQFIDMTSTQRQQAVLSAKLCFACLGPHPRSQCKSTFSCRLCHNRSHHTLLHQPSGTKFESNPKIVGAIASAQLNCQPSNTSSVLLGTAFAQVQCASGLWHKVRLFVDPGSMVDFVTSSLVQTLGLEKTHTNGHVTGLGQTPISTLQSTVKFSLAPMGSEPTPLLELNATVIPTITAKMPSSPVPPQLANQFKNLADYSIFQKPSKVDILLGAAHLSEILLAGQAIIPGEPSCWPTIFGNILIGKIPNQCPDSHSTSHFVQSQEELNHQLKMFWEVEEATPRCFTDPDEDAVDKHFSSTHQRNEFGQFIVRLPFKDSALTNLGSTRQIAMRQLQATERKLSRDSHIKQLYHENMRSYIDQDQMEPASNPSPYVLPHHAIVKNDSSSHPVRIVFNASQISDTKKTLNQCMYSGPKLQKDVGDIILQFRLRAVALCCDIRQMYRAIIIHPDDRQFQHIFWRFDSDQPVTEWELKRLTFGFTPASYIAQKCLYVLAASHEDIYPDAADVINKCCYVDDIVCSTNSPDDAMKLCQDLVSLLQSGGFELKKFTSSHHEVLANIPVEDQEPSLALDGDTLKVLGLQWDPKKDAFYYNVNIKSSDIITKRLILSNVASIFDVNGYITHLVIFLKILLQKIWISHGNWDDPLSPPLLDAWKNFVQELPLLADLKIPRYISSPHVINYQIVAFADASTAAYAAMVYLRITCDDGSIFINLLRAKSKVAPLKTISVPRLELCAAHLLVKVLTSLESFLVTVNPISNITCFTDSTTVLAWLQTPPHQLKTFVANRVAAITDVAPPSQWRHVPTNHNPADLATRGLLPSHVLDQYDFWFHGPKFSVKRLSSGLTNSLLPHPILCLK